MKLNDVIDTNNLPRNRTVPNSKAGSLPNIDPTSDDSVLDDKPEKKIRSSVNKASPAKPRESFKQPQKAKPKMQMQQSPPPKTVGSSTKLSNVMNLRPEIRAKKLKGIHIPTPSEIAKMSPDEIKMKEDEISGALNRGTSLNFISIGGKFMPIIYENIFNWYISPMTGWSLRDFAKKMNESEEYAEIIDIIAWEYGSGGGVPMRPELRLILLMMQMTMASRVPNDKLYAIESAKKGATKKSDAGEPIFEDKPKVEPTPDRKRPVESPIFEDKPRVPTNNLSNTEDIPDNIVQKYADL